MNIHIIVSLSTLFFGFGYAYGDSRKISFVKILMTLIVVAPLGFQIYQSYASEYFVFTALSLGAGFYLGWNKEFPAGEWLLSLRRAVPKPNFRNNFASDERKKQEKAYSEANKQAELDRERRRRADEMKKERERERARQKSESEKRPQSNEQSESTQNQVPPKKRVPEPVDRRSAEQILGLKPGWTKEDLKKAFREKSKKVHPDNWNGMPQKLQKEMEEEQKRVNNAYSELS
jgi:curved DNA-binding protein CbpA